MSNLTNFPTIRPSLLLDFANSKQVDPRITFTRASTATYYNARGVLRTAASGVPRIDHAPVTGECKGLLIEEARTNLLKYSEQFDDAAWTKAGVTVTANAATAPDGAVTMDKLVESDTNVWHNVAQDTSIAAKTYAFSVVAKAGERSVLQLVPNEAMFPEAYVNFDLSTGAVSASSGVDSAGMVHLGGGIYRCWLVDTATSASTAASVYLSPQNSPTAARAAAYTGDGTSGLYIWGAQLEEGSFPTSYIPTSSAAATRAVDAASMTGTNFSEWFRQDEGTLVAEASSNGNDDADGVVAMSDGSSNNRMIVRRKGDTKNGAAFVIAGGTTVASMATPVGSYPVGVSYKQALSYALDNFAYALNGAPPITDTAGGLPTGVNELRIGANSDGGLLLNGHIRRIAFVPKRLANAELQALTA